MPNPNEYLDFASIIRELKCDRIRELATGPPEDNTDVPTQVFEFVLKPEGFPAIEAAIVPGDRVALAVDANLACISGVVTGAIKALGQTQASEIVVIVSDEATDATLELIKEEIGPEITVIRHTPAKRESLRYLGADETADPIYLNRYLVDADFVLPIACIRPLEPADSHDLTGIFPGFADSRSRLRHLARICQEDKHFDSVGTSSKSAGDKNDVNQAAVLLGCQVMVGVLASQQGAAGRIIAGPPATIAKKTGEEHSITWENSSAPLVIASLDGDQQQQTWDNAARALFTASQLVAPGGTIVLWTNILQSPAKLLVNLNTDDTDSDLVEQLDKEEFPRWDDQAFASKIFTQVSAEHRIVMRADFDQSLLEGMGLGTISSKEELARLSEGFDSAAVVRAAQFAGMGRLSSTPNTPP